MNLEKELIVAKSLALDAGKRILEIYELNEQDVMIKQGKSPVTKADLESNKIIITGIQFFFPDHGILSEETIDDKERLNKDFVWIIDPLDGTKEFIKRNGEFTVNIALTYKGRPVLGVIYAPVLDQLFYASLNKGAFVQERREKERKINVSKRIELNKFILIISRSHASEKIEKIIDKIRFSEIKKKGSSLKGCMIANGDADVYYRTGPTNEWDVCAFDILIKEAGGKVTDLEGNELKYNKKNTLINGFLVSNNQIHEKLLDLVK